MSKPGPRLGSKQAHPKEPKRAIGYLELVWQGLAHVEIAEHFGVSQQAVSGALKWLAERGYDVPERQRGAGSHRRNEEKSTS